MLPPGCSTLILGEAVYSGLQTNSPFTDVSSHESFKFLIRTSYSHLKFRRQKSRFLTSHEKTPNVLASLDHILPVIKLFPLDGVWALEFPIVLTPAFI